MERVESGVLIPKPNTDNSMQALLIRALLVRMNQLESKMDDMAQQLERLKNCSNQGLTTI
jgi:hypothetical protein